MPNLIEFFVPAPAQNGHIDLTLGPKEFLGQFSAASKPQAALPDPRTLRGSVQLIAAALDSGHGANLAPMPTMNLMDRWQLQYHGLVQRLTVISLLRRSSVGWQRAPFAEHLEKSMRTSNAFLLGMLYARVSTDHWASTNGWGKVDRFWHYNVLESSAFSFTAVTSASKAGNPDFLVQFSNGNWACVEAKGTLEGFDEERLRDGMRQACKITSVSWLAPGSTNPVPAAPSSQACSLAYFDAGKGNTLEVYHLDPPPRNSTSHGTLPVPVWFLESGDFIAWQCAIDQFRSMVQVRDSQWPAALPRGALTWTPFGADELIWVGIPKVLLSAADAIDWSLDCLGWLLPELRKWRNTSVKAPDRPRAGKRRLRRLSKLATERALSETPTSPMSRCWLLLAASLEGLGMQRPDATWNDALSEVWNAQLLIPVPFSSLGNVDDPYSMQNLWRTLHESKVPTQENWILGAEFVSKDNEGSSLSVAETARGLLVMAYQEASHA